MKSVNKVLLVGRLASDLDSRQTKNGKFVANFPLAISRKRKDEKGGDVEVVDYHKVVVWGKLGEVCLQYLTKGMKVFVEGAIVNRTYDDSQGIKRYKTEIVANDVNFLSYRKDQEKAKA